jgi:hypothetical protein
MLRAFDFGEAIALPFDERVRASMARAKAIVEANGYARLSSFPVVPDVGGTKEEIDTLERSLGAPLPTEYRAFLERHRYLVLDDGYNIGGLPHGELHVAEGPWLSTVHPIASGPALVIGFYWRYADGDQLLIPLGEPHAPVVAYLHEYPTVEPFAPSFSLALWRLTAECLDDVLAGQE